MFPKRKTHVLRFGQVIKVRGQQATTAATRVVSCLTPPQQEKRTINAALLHGDEQEFWLEKRWYKVKKERQTLMPTWDRFAQALILMTRPVPRVVPEAAFRLLAVFLKVLLLERLVGTAAPMLPVWQAANMTNVLHEAKGPERMQAEREAEQKAEAEQPKE